MKKQNQPEVAAATVAAPSQTTQTKKADVKAANIIETLVSRQQHFIYKAQAAAEKLSPKKAKQFRQKMRRKLEGFYFSICIKKDGPERKAAIQEFIAFYKEHYILQDFSIASLTDSRDSDKRESYAQMLKIVQESLTK